MTALLLVLMMTVFNAYIYIEDKTQLEKMEASMDLIYSGIQYCQISDYVLDYFELNIMNEEATIYCMDCMGATEVNIKFPTIWEQVICEDISPILVKRIDGEIYMTRDI